MRNVLCGILNSFSWPQRRRDTIMREKKKQQTEKREKDVMSKMKID